MLIAFLENNLNADGSIRNMGGIQKAGVLQQYMGGKVNTQRDQGVRRYGHR